VFPSVPLHTHSLVHWTVPLHALFTLLRISLSLPFHIFLVYTFTILHTAPPSPLLPSAGCILPLDTFSRIFYTYCILHTTRAWLHTPTFCTLFADISALGYTRTARTRTCLHILHYCLHTTRHATGPAHTLRVCPSPTAVYTHTPTHRFATGLLFACFAGRTHMPDLHIRTRTHTGLPHVSDTGPPHVPLYTGPRFTRRATPTLRLPRICHHCGFSPHAATFATFRHAHHARFTLRLLFGFATDPTTQPSHTLPACCLGIHTRTQFPTFTLRFTTRGWLPLAFSVSAVAAPHVHARPHLHHTAVCALHAVTRVHTGPHAFVYVTFMFIICRHTRTVLHTRFMPRFIYHVLFIHAFLHTLPTRTPIFTHLHTCHYHTRRFGRCLPADRTSATTSFLFADFTLHLPRTHCLHTVLYTPRGPSTTVFTDAPAHALPHMTLHGSLHTLDTPRYTAPFHAHTTLLTPAFPHIHLQHTPGLPAPVTHTAATFYYTHAAHTPLPCRTCTPFGLPLHH